MENPKPFVLDYEILKRINEFLEDFYTKSVKAGNQLSEVKLKNAQVRGLETLITSAARFSEIINYIKNQAGKDKKNQWTQAAPFLLPQLDDLEKKAKELGKNDPEITLDVKLRLARGWAKQVVAHYLYANIQKEEESR